MIIESCQTDLNPRTWNKSYSHREDRLYHRANNYLVIGFSWINHLICPWGNTSWFCQCANPPLSLIHSEQIQDGSHSYGNGHCPIACNY